MVQYSKKNWLKKTRRTSEISDRERERSKFEEGNFFNGKLDNNLPWFWEFSFSSFL